MDTVSVLYILKNRIYLGETVQGRYEYTRSGSIPVRRKPQEEWYITPGTHEPLVDVETWELVQKKIKSPIN